jgi:hypothetical protein
MTQDRRNEITSGRLPSRARLSQRRGGGQADSHEMSMLLLELQLTTLGDT